MDLTATTAPNGMTEEELFVDISSVLNSESVQKMDYIQRLEKWFEEKICDTSDLRYYYQEEMGQYDIEDNTGEILAREVDLFIEKMQELELDYNSLSNYLFRKNNGKVVNKLVERLADIDFIPNTDSYEWIVERIQSECGAIYIDTNRAISAGVIKKIREEEHFDISPIETFIRYCGDVFMEQADDFIEAYVERVCAIGTYDNYRKAKKKLGGRLPAKHARIFNEIETKKYSRAYGKTSSIRDILSSFAEYSSANNNVSDNHLKILAMSFKALAAEVSEYYLIVDYASGDRMNIFYRIVVLGLELGCFERMDQLYQLLKYVDNDHDESKHYERVILQRIGEKQSEDILLVENVFELKRQILINHGKCSRTLGSLAENVYLLLSDFGFGPKAILRYIKNDISDYTTFRDRMIIVFLENNKIRSLNQARTLYDSISLSSGKSGLIKDLISAQIDSEKLINLNSTLKDLSWYSDCYDDRDEVQKIVGEKVKRTINSSSIEGIRHMLDNYLRYLGNDVDCSRLYEKLAKADYLSFLKNESDVLRACQRLASTSFHYNNIKIMVYLRHIVDELKRLSPSFSELFTVMTSTKNNCHDYIMMTMCVEAGMVSELDNLTYIERQLNEHCEERSVCLDVINHAINAKTSFSPNQSIDEMLRLHKLYNGKVGRKIKQQLLQHISEDTENMKDSEFFEFGKNMYDLMSPQAQERFSTIYVDYKMDELYRQDLNMFDHIKKIDWNSSLWLLDIRVLAKLKQNRGGYDEGIYQQLTNYCPEEKINRALYEFVKYLLPLASRSKYNEIYSFTNFHRPYYSELMELLTQDAYKWLSPYLRKGKVSAVFEELKSINFFNDEDTANFLWKFYGKKIFRIKNVNIILRTLNKLLPKSENVSMLMLKYFEKHSHHLMDLLRFVNDYGNSFSTKDKKVVEGLIKERMQGMTEMTGLELEDLYFLFNSKELNVELEFWSSWAKVYFEKTQPKKMQILAIHELSYNKDLMIDLFYLYLDSKTKISKRNKKRLISDISNNNGSEWRKLIQKINEK